MYYFTSESQVSGSVKVTAIANAGNLQSISRHFKDECRKVGILQVKRSKNTFTVNIRGTALPLLDQVLCSVYGEWVVGCRY